MSTSRMIAATAAVFLLFGLFVADRVYRLIELELSALDTIGLWIQVVAAAVALSAAVVARVRPRPDRG